MHPACVSDLDIQCKQTHIISCTCAHRPTLTSVPTTTPAHSHVAAPVRLCSIAHPPSFQLHLQDAGEGNRSRRGVSNRYTAKHIHNHNEVIVLLCLILHLHSLQLHLHDAGEGSMGRLGVPPRQQQVYIRAQPHKLCDVQVHLLQDTLSQTPYTNVCDVRTHSRP